MRVAAHQGHAAGGSRSARGRSPLVPRQGKVALACAALLSVFSRVNAQFLEPRKLSDAGGRVLQANVGVNLSGHAYVAWTAGEELFLDIIGVDSSRRIMVSELSRSSGDPVMATNNLGAVYIAFTQEDPEIGGRDIHLVSIFGVDLRSRKVSESPGDEWAPKIYLDRLGSPHLVWAERRGNDPAVMYLAPGGHPVRVAHGDYPQIAMEGGGTAHLVYSRGRDLFAVNDRDGSFGWETPVTRSVLSEELYPSIAVSESGVVLIAYERKGGLYYQESVDGGSRFGPPRLLDSGGVSTPELRVIGDPATAEIFSISYEMQGELYYTRGSIGGALLEPAQVIESPYVESRPSLAVDPEGVLHISFIRDGEVYYTNNAGVLKPDFTADSSQGEGPLTVRFKDLSSGSIQLRRWDFGDGSGPSEEEDPVHVYQAAGKYTVSLRVFGTASDAVVEKKDYVLVQTPNNRLWIPDQLVMPGQKEIWFPVLAYHKEPLQGFELAGTFDPNVLTLKEITYQGTAVGSLPLEPFPAYWPSFSNDPSGAYFHVGMIFDFMEPFDNTMLPAPSSGGHRLVHLVFDVSEFAPEGDDTLVELRNRVGPDSKLHNVFIMEGQGLLPALKSSTTSIFPITGPGPIPLKFKRGDVDGNGDVDLTDAIAVLQFLFLGGPEPRCMDAADLHDSGGVDIADPIGILSYAFLGGQAPAVPFPTAGLDPTPDGLKDCKR